MAITRINNNQISDASAGNVYLGINAAVKLQNYSITATKIANSLTYGSDLVITGNLTVQGNTTTIDTVNLIVDDPLMLLAAQQTGAPAVDIGFIGQRGTSNNIALVWQESSKQFITAYTTTSVSNTTISVQSYANFQTLNANVTGILTVTGETGLTGNATFGNVFVGSSKTIDVGNNIIANVQTPSANSDAATKGYVDGISSTGFVVSDGSNTQTIAGGATLYLRGTANQVSVVVGATDNVTIGLPSSVTISGNMNTGNVATGILTANGQIISTSPGSASDGASQLYLNGSGNNRIDFNTNGTGAPAFTTRSAGTKLLLYPALSGSQVDYAIGIDAATMWSSVPSSDPSFSFKWYGATTEIAVLDASGSFSVASNLTSDATVTGVTVTASGNLNGDNATIANAVVAATGSFTGNVLAGNLNSNAAVTGVTITASGNLNGNNATITNAVSAATGAFTGNVTTGNVSGTTVAGTTGTFTGNVTTGNVSGTTISGTTGTFTGNVLAGNLNSNAAITGVTVTATGNLVGGNANITNAVNAASGAFTGNVTTGNVSGTTVSGTSGVFTGNVTTGNVSGTTVSGTTGSFSGNVLAGNLNSNAAVTGVTITASGNLVGGNASITNAVNAATGAFSGNVTTGNVSGTTVAGTTGTFTGNVNGGNVNTNNIVGTGVTITSTGSIVLVPTGNITVNNRYINNLAEPIQAQDAATKEYVDNAVSQGLQIHPPVYVEATNPLTSTYVQGGTTATVITTVAGNTVVFGSAISPQLNDQYWFTNSFNGIVGNVPYFVVSAPNTSAAVLTTTWSGQAVANITGGTGLSEPVRINSGIGATLTNAGANAQLTVDSVALSTTQRVLVYAQTNAYENGVYTVTEAGNATTAWQMTRSSDTNTYGPKSTTQLDAGDYFFVQAGANAAGEAYVMTAPVGSFIIGYNGLTFTQFSASSTYSANIAAGLILNGTIFSAKIDNISTAFDGTGNIKVKDGATLVTPNIGNATGNSLTLSGNGLLSATTVTATGNVLAGNVNSNAAITGVTITASGNLNGNNATITNAVAAASGVFTGNVTTGNVSGGIGSFTGNVLAGNLNSNAAVTGVTITASGNLNGNNATITNAVAAATGAFTGNVSASNVNVTSSTASTSKTTGALTVAGGVGVGADLYAGNSIVVDGGAYGNVTTTQFASVFGSGGGPNPYSIMQVRASDGASGLGMQAFTGSGILYGNTNIIFALATIRDRDVPSNLVTKAYIDSTGLNVTGIVSATGNVTGGNIISNALVSGTSGGFTGNVLAGNVNSNAAVTGVTLTASGNLNGNNATITNAVAAATGAFTGNVLAGNVNSNAAVTGVTITASGNLNGNNATITNAVAAATGAFTGNVLAGNLNSNAVVTGVTLTASGNLNGNNATITNAVAAATGAFTGNVTTGNVSGTTVSGTTGSFTGNVLAGNLNSNAAVTGVTITASGNLTAGNISTTGKANLGNIRISGDDITGTNGIVTFNSTNADVDFKFSGTSNGLLVLDAGTNTVNIGTVTPVTGAKLQIASTDSVLIPVGNTTQRPTGVTGMIRFNTVLNQLEMYNNTTWAGAGSVFTVIAADEFVGNGVQSDFTLSANSTTAATIVAINGVMQIPTTAYSVSGNVLSFTEAPAVSDYIDARGFTTTTTVTGISNATNTAIIAAVDGVAQVNITGNLVPISNITYNLGSSTNYWNNLYLAGNTIFLGSLQLKDIGGNTFAVYTNNGTTAANLSVGNIAVSSIVSGTSVIGIAGAGGNAYITVGGTANVLVVASTGANITGTLGVSSNITAVGNVSGSYFIGNGSQLTGIDATAIQNGTANVRAFNNANVTVSASGNANILVVTGTGANIAGTLNATGNVTGANLITAGNVYTPAIINNGPSNNTQISLGETVGIIAITINGNSTQFLPSGQIALGGASQIVGGTFSGSGLTLGGSQTDIFQNRGGNVTVQVGAGGTIANTWTFAQNGSFTSPGNITGGNVSGTTGAFTNVGGTLTTAAQTNITSVGTLTSLGVTGNITSGNVQGTTHSGTTGTFSGNVSGANINTNSIVGTTVTITSTGNLSLAPSANITVNSKNINLLAEPVLATDAATKNYVDSVATGLNIHEAAYVATTGTLAIATSGTVTYNNGSSGVGANLVTTGTYLLIDGGNVQTAGTRILVKNEANAAWNGIYTYSNTTVIVRATDFDTTADIAGGDFLFVTSGSTQADTGWVQTTDNVVVGTNNIVFNQFSGVGTYKAGTGLTLTDQTFSVNASQTQVTSVGTLGSLAVTGNITSGNLQGTSIAGTLTTAAQTNITSVGTLTSLAVTGNITSGNLQGTSIAGTLTTAAQTNITSVGTLTSLGVTGNITSGNLSGTSIVGTLTTAAQTNITSVGTLTSLGVTGNITSGNLSVGTGVVTLGGIVNANGNAVGNIGSASLYFNTVFAKATSAQYADLAEMYEADQFIPSGTVVCFGGSKEITVCSEDASRRVAGVISTNPSYIMNAGLLGDCVVAVALTGRVPCRVTGAVRKGDMMVSTGDGRARAEENPATGSVIGKSLADFDGVDGVIEVVVGRL